MKMKIQIGIKSVSFLYLLSACANQNLAPPLPEKGYQSIAEDATQQLVRLYPPAQTHFVLELQNRTGFDRQFKTLLRNKGYAIHETQEITDKQNIKGKRFAYILDALSDVSHYGFYRLTLAIDEAQLSRLYDANDLKKPNYWSYRQ